MSTSYIHTNEYTNMDFDSIYNELIDYFKNDENSPIKDYDFQGSNIVQLMKILAYTTHLNLFNTSIALNEMYFSTSRLRKNLLKNIKPYGYLPRRTTSSQKYLTISNSTTVDITIPVFSGFNAIGETESKIFYTIESYIIPANSTSSILVYQFDNGQETKTFDLEILNGKVTPIEIEVPNLSNNYFIVETIENGEIVSWIQYENLDSLQNELDNAELTLLTETNFYFLDETDTGYELSFSETGIGAIPNPDDGKTLSIKYATSDGTSSNGYSTSNFSFITEIANLEILDDNDILSVSSISPSAGGQNKETIEELRENTIALFNSQNRAVTEYDYTKLGRNISLIGNTGDIKVFGGEKYSTGERLGNVYIIAVPGLDNQYFFTNSEKDEILNYFLKYNIVGITPIVQNPHFINAIINSNFTYKNLITDTLPIKDELNQIIVNYFKSNFGETIYLPNLIKELNSIYGVESAFISANYKIIFDNLSSLLGTYKIIPIANNDTDIDDFINSDGSFVLTNVYGLTSGDYGTILFVNHSGKYIVVEQVAGVNNNNFINFHKGTAFIDTRKDITNIIYTSKDEEKELYVPNPDGFLVGESLVSKGTAGITTAEIQSINKKTSGIKYSWIQVSSSSGLSVGTSITNQNNLIATIKETSWGSNNKIFINYTSGTNSDFADGQNFSTGTTYSVPGTHSVVKRAWITLSSGTAATLSLSTSITTNSSFTGYIETLDIPNNKFYVRWTHSSSNFVNGQMFDVGTSYSAGAYAISTSSGVTLLTTGTGELLYKINVSDITGTGFEENAETEPGENWGFNIIASTTATTITLIDAVYGLSEGDYIVCSASSGYSDITNITGLVVTVTNASGFITGSTVHVGSSWANVLKTTINKVNEIYDETLIDKLVVSNTSLLVSSNYLISNDGLSFINSISNNTCDITMISGTFTSGTNNVYQINSESTNYEPLYTLNGNIEDFESNYIIETDDDNLPLIINKMDYSESGMLDQSINNSITDYSLIFNTTENLDKDNIVIKLTYGTNSEITLLTEENTKYEAKLLLDSSYGSNLAISNYITSSSGVIGYVHDIVTSGINNYLIVRYDTGTWEALSTGSTNNIQIGTSYSTGDNIIRAITYTTATPSMLNYIASSTDSSNYYASVNLLTGDVRIKRALNVYSANINTIDNINNIISFTNSTGFLTVGTDNPLIIWDNNSYQFSEWEYISNDGTNLTSPNSIPSTIESGMLALQELNNKLVRIEFSFKNKIDKLKLGNRSLFYSNLDLIKEI